MNVTKLMVVALAGWINQQQEGDDKEAIAIVKRRHAASIPILNTARARFHRCDEHEVGDKSGSRQ